MGRLEELRKEKEQLEQAYQNILEAGQEFQTRDGRVKQASLKEVMTRLNAVKAEIAEYEYETGGRTDTVLLKFNGM